MTDLLSAFRSVATSLVESTGFGRSLTYRAAGTATVDKVAGSATPGATTNHTLTGVVREYSIHEIAKSEGRIQAGDLEITFAEPAFTAAIGRAPSTDDVITDAGIEYRIQPPVRGIPAGSGNAGWLITARRSS